MTLRGMAQIFRKCQPVVSQLSSSVLGVMVCSDNTSYISWSKLSFTLISPIHPLCGKAWVRPSPKACHFSAMSVIKDRNRCISYELQACAPARVICSSILFLLGLPKCFAPGLPGGGHLILAAPKVPPNRIGYPKGGKT